MQECASVKRFISRCPMRCGLATRRTTSKLIFALGMTSFITGVFFIALGEIQLVAAGASAGQSGGIFSYFERLGNPTANMSISSIYGEAVGKFIMGILLIVAGLLIMLV